MEPIADTLAKEKAQLWINHDKAQTDTSDTRRNFMTDTLRGDQG
jgi:hypothetical protein